ncbi:hypothetical protein TNCV_106161 [Trichonephila clavipes]|nr:hypothetical protein TNCV_106161 [Trichonephila clavipes]
MPVFSAASDMGPLRSILAFRITVLNPSIPYSANSHIESRPTRAAILRYDKSQSRDTRAIDDGPRHFEPRSSEEKLTFHPTNIRTRQREYFASDPLHDGSLEALRLKLMIRQPRVHDHAPHTHPTDQT